MRLTLPNETNSSPSVGDVGIPDTGKQLFQKIKLSFQNGFKSDQKKASTPSFETPDDITTVNNDSSLFTKISAGQASTIRTKDSATDLLAKLLILFQVIQKEKKKENILNHNFAEEKNEKLLKQHNEIIEAFGGKSKFSKVTKKKKEGTGLLGKLLLGAALFSFSDDVMANTKDVVAKVKGFFDGGDFDSELSNLWTITKDVFDKYEIVKNMEQFTTPMMNWLHDRLSSIFGETAIDMVFKKKPEQTELEFNSEGSEGNESSFKQLDSRTQSVSTGTTEGPSVKMSSGRKDMMKKVFNAFKSAEFSDNQAIALTAEVGRENGYIEETVFGTHRDQGKGNKINMGFLSWQAERGIKLEKHMRSKGLLDENGNMYHTQESLNEMAKFTRVEMNARKNKKFLENGDIGRDEAGDLLANFIGWAKGQTTIGDKGHRVAFDSPKHEAVVRGHYQTLVQMQQSGQLNPPTMLAAATTGGDDLNNKSVENIDGKKKVRAISNNPNIFVNNNTTLFQTQNNNNHVSNDSTEPNFPLSKTLGIN